MTDRVVVDASIFGPLLFADERLQRHAQLDGVLTAGLAIVPAHWPLEIMNMVQSAIKRGRCSLNDVRPVIGDLIDVAVEVVPVTLSVERIEAAFALGLTIYDHAYLDLARGRGARLLTADARLAAAARAAGVTVA